ncbi:MAG: hypothetical protein KC561_05975 [Myxococcales bacterium]|nr:hypothetical protein [Myxococcales bacterium]
MIAKDDRLGLLYLASCDRDGVASFDTSGQVGSKITQAAVPEFGMVERILRRQLGFGDVLVLLLVRAPVPSHRDWA